MTGDLPASRLTSSLAPIEVHVTRGEGDLITESLHACHAVVCRGGGKSHSEVLASFGERDLPVFPRSAIKMLQAVAYAENEAAQSLTAESKREEDCLAISCGSHGGEEGHVSLVRHWLGTLGLEERHLACGTHAPLDKASAATLVQQGAEPQPAHHMCSGKHCGMLTLARAQGWDVEGYCEHDHPVQRRVREVCEDFFTLDLTCTTRGRDGCSVPTFAVPLQALARGMARFTTHEGLEGRRGRAASRLFAAMTSRPFLIAGSKQADTLLTEQGGGRFVVKAGAEGVYTAVVRELSLGIAVKCVDGASRAARAAMALLLRELGLLEDGLKMRDYGRGRRGAHDYCGGD